jgi:uncharacterized protein (TIGR00725 family)
MKQAVVTIFGSSRIAEGSRSYRDVRRLGMLLARAGFRVCNGGYGGVMEAAARGAKESGGKTTGITTAQFTRSRPNLWLDRKIQMPTWRDRLFRLIDSGDAYVICEGGTGTLVELACVWEMTRKGLMPAKPVVVLGSLWKRAIRLLTLSPEIGRDRFIHFAKSPSAAVRFLRRAIKKS